MNRFAIPKRAILIVLALAFGACTPGSTAPPTITPSTSTQTFNTATAQPTTGARNPPTIVAVTDTPSPATRTPAPLPLPPSPTTAPTLSPAPTPDLSNLSTAELVRAIVQPPNLLHSVTAVQIALARAGVATTDLYQVYVPAASPAASAVASPEETLKLALEARQRATMGTMTVAELGQMLKDFGFPFASERAPGEHLIQFLSSWTTACVKTPQDPQCFNVLFLAEMARQQEPAVDLAANTADPGELHLTMLELEIFAAAFDRETTTAYRQDPPHNMFAGVVNAIVPAAYAAEPCSEVNERLGLLGENIEITGKAHALAILESTHVISHETAHYLNDALHALGALARIWKLAEVLRKANVVVSIEGVSNPVHKRTLDDKSDPDDNPMWAEFVATGGISDKDWEEYQSSMEKLVLDSEIGKATRDCFKSLGLPDVASMEDIAKSVDEWRVRWVGVEGLPSEHAAVDVDKTKWYNPGHLEQHLVRSGEYSAQARLFVRIYPEYKRDHPGEQKTHKVTLRAELETDTLPELKTWYDALIGGLHPAAKYEAIIDILAGWAQAIITPKSYATLKITYHIPAELELHFYSKFHDNAVSRIVKPPDINEDEQSHTLILSAKVPLKYDTKSQDFRGSAPLEYVIAEGDGRHLYNGSRTCTFKDTGKKNGQLEVISLTLEPDGTDARLILALDKHPQETFHLDCNWGKRSWDTDLWASLFMVSHKKEMQGDSAEIRGWENLASTSGDHPIQLRKVYNKSLQSIPSSAGSKWVYDEDTTLEIVAKEPQ